MCEGNITSNVLKSKKYQVQKNQETFILEH